MRNLEGYGFMAACSGYPHVVTIEEFMEGIPCPSHMKWSFWVARHVESWVVKKAGNLVAISEHVKKRLLKMGAKGAIHNIPNVASDVFYTVQKKPPQYLLYVGRISPEKGLLDIIHALARDECKVIAPKLVVVGGASGPEGEAYVALCKKEAAKLLKPRQFDYRGPFKSHEVAKLHEEAFALVMPSTAKYEGMPVVIAEALAAGTPVITYDFGPMPELIIQKKTGLIVPAGDIAKLGMAIRQCLEMISLTITVNKDARESAQQYRPDKVSANYNDLFNSIMNF
jgi:glycosyltransferase involved in cell wall biosynthesis